MSFGNAAFAQQSKIESLKKRLSRATPKDSLAINMELGQIYEIELIDHTNALRHNKISHQLASRLGDSLSIVLSGRRMSELYNRLNILDSSLLACVKTLPIARRNGFEEEYGKILNTLGIVYIERGKYDVALQDLFESLSITEKLHDSTSTSTTLFSIGLLYYKIHDDDKALKYYHRSLEIKNKISDNWKLETLLLNISLCYSDKLDFEKSRKYIDQVKQLCKQKNCSRLTELELQVAEGLHFLRSDSLFDAEMCFLKGLPLAEAEHNIRLGLDCQLNLSKIYLQQHKLDVATQFLKQVEESENAAGFNNELLQLYTQLISIYKETGDYKMMAHYQGQYIQLRDSISGDDVRNNLMRTQAGYLERENEAKIKSQAELLTLQDDVISRQKIVRTLVIAVVILFIILAIVLYKVSKNKKIANALLDQQVAERTKELEISYRNLRVTMEERDATLRKVATEIRTSMITVAGLCSTGVKDVSDPATIAHLENINKTSHELLNLSSDLASET